MKKKTFAVVVSVFLLVLIIGIIGAKHSKDPEIKGTTDGALIINDTTKSEEEETKKPSSNSGKKPSKDPDKIIETKIPLVFLEEKYQNNLELYVEEKGYNSARLSSDGKFVLVKKRAFTNSMELLNVGATTISALCEIFESKKFPYVIDLGTYKDNFSFVTYIVNGEKYSKVENKDALFDYAKECCAYYLLQDIDAPDEFTIVISDEDGNEIERRTFNKNDYLK